MAVICTTTRGTDTGLCEPLWSIPLNCLLMMKFEMMHILQAQVCDCISVYSGLPHQKMKQETSDASKSQLNQAGWNGKVFKFGSEIHLSAHNYLLIRLGDSPLLARSRKSHITVSLMGFAPVLRIRSRKDWEGFGWSRSRIPNNTRSRSRCQSRIFCPTPTPEIQLDHYYITFLSWEFLLKWHNFLWNFCCNSYL